jgi:hypothetical protein
MGKKDKNRKPEDGSKKGFENFENYDESIYQFLMLNNIQKPMGKSCPPAFQISSYFEKYVLKSKKGLLSTSVGEELKKHITDCKSCMSLIQDLQKAHNYKEAFVLNQRDVDNNSLKLARDEGAAALPGYLENFMKNSFKNAGQIPSEEEKEGLLSLIFRLTKEGINISHNGLFPLRIFQHEGIALRGNNEFPSYNINQELKNGHINYQVFREKDDEVMLTIKLDRELSDDFSYVKLIKGNRILSSINFNDKHMVIFNQLKVGNYLLELLGKSKYSVKMALV